MRCTEISMDKYKRNDTYRPLPSFSRPTSAFLNSKKQPLSLKKILNGDKFGTSFASVKSKVRCTEISMDKYKRNDTYRPLPSFSRPTSAFLNSKKQPLSLKKILNGDKFGTSFASTNQDREYTETSSDKHIKRSLSTTFCFFRSAFDLPKQQDIASNSLKKS